MNGNNTKPKLELQVNVPQKIKLLLDQPATGTSQYGDWWLYNVLSNEQELSFFAPESVVKFITENSLKRNSELEITKQIIKNGKKNVTDYKISIVNKEAEEEDRKVHTEPTGKAKVSSTDNGVPESNQTQNSNEYKKMLYSMKEAVLIRNELGADVDINKIGITLFIQKCKDNHQNY